MSKGWCIQTTATHFITGKLYDCYADALLDIWRLAQNTYEQIEILCIVETEGQYCRTDECLLFTESNHPHCIIHS
jgi:hypothetical protein